MENSNCSCMANQQMDEVQDLTEYLRRLIKLSQFPIVLELGSRQVTKDSLVQILDFKEGTYKYIGFDLLPGPNVDVVGDAHELSKYFPQDSFDLIISKSVFEHIAMPWKVVLEMNKVIKIGGIVFINTLFMFPMHELPWDFWRYTTESWKILFNSLTGFQVVRIEHNTPVKLLLEEQSQYFKQDELIGFINSNVLARKISDYDQNRLKWDVSAIDILNTIYPHK